MAGYKMSADMGGGGSARSKPNPGRKAAMNDRERLELQVSRAQDPGIKGYKATTKFAKRSKILDATEVRDTKRKDALTQALLKIKPKYVFSSGNLRKRLGAKRPRILDA